MEQGSAAPYWWLIAKEARYLISTLDRPRPDDAQSRPVTGVHLAALDSLVQLTLKVDECRERFGTTIGNERDAFGHDYSDEMTDALHRLNHASPISEERLRRLGRHTSLHWASAADELDEDDRTAIESWRQWLDPGDEHVERTPSSDSSIPSEGPREFRKAAIDLLRWTVQDIWPIAVKSSDPRAER